MSEQTENNENKTLSSENGTQEEEKSTNDTLSENPTTQEVTVHKHHHTHDEAEEEFKFEKDPEFEIDYKGDCLYSVKITVPAVNIKSQTSKNLEELKEHAEVPGFRKGKAPIWLVKINLGKPSKRSQRKSHFRSSKKTDGR
jgi:trigger factor